MRANIAIVIISSFLLNSNFSFSQSKFLINNEPFELPGKWETKGLLKESGQYHLYNKKKKLNLLISVRNSKNFEFYNDTLTSSQLVEKWYKWETDHWAGQDVEIKEIKHNVADNYIMWRLTLNKFSDYNQSLVSTILYFIRNQKLIGVSLNDSSEKNHMTDIEIMVVLETLYKQ